MYRCKDCNCEINEGEYKTFGICDACWDKHWKKSPSSDGQVERLVRLTDLHGYKTSRDYHKLFTVACTAPIICIVDYNECRDIACTLFYKESYVISARGISYVYGFDREDFVKQCKEENVEWLVPEHGAGA